MTASGQPRVVVGVGGSQASLAALRWAAAEARLRGVILHVVHARESVKSRAPYASAATTDGGVAGVDDPSPACGLLKDALTAVFGSEVPNQVTAELVAGRPEAVLVSCSAGADLLVLGSTSAVHGFGAPFGPVLRACLRAVRCPVVTIAMPPNLQPSLADR